MNGKFLTIDDVVNATGLHRTSVTRLIAQGEIPATRLGRRILVSPEFLESLAANARANLKRG